MSGLETILRVENLRKVFPARTAGLFVKSRRFNHAVDGVSFHVEKGETFGIVGESGSGKTTLARLILRLTNPTGGRILYKEQDINEMTRSEMKRFRRQVQMVFQDPYSSLDPRQRVFDIVAEPLKIHRIGDRTSIEERVREALGLVDLPASQDFLWKVPDELSGGERQRLGIARGVVLGAELIVADEPVSMLDASVKAGIISLMTELKEERGLTYVFITHEIALAYHVCNRMAVMYSGKIVELGGAEEVVGRPLHPYTALVMDAVPPLLPDDEWDPAGIEEPDLPSLSSPPEGCAFYSRCSLREDICRGSSPELVEVQEGRYLACFRCAPRS
ncbi:MAG: oligopeptide/dipeptide ABC transporter ATP-binding protein [Acidobacteriota bacterium]